MGQKGRHNAKGKCKSATKPRGKIVNKALKYNKKEYHDASSDSSEALRDYIENLLDESAEEDECAKLVAVSGEHLQQGGGADDTPKCSRKQKGPAHLAGLLNEFDRRGLGAFSHPDGDNVLTSSSSSESDEEGSWPGEASSSLPSRGLATRSAEAGEPVSLQALQEAGVMVLPNGGELNMVNLSLEERWPCALLPRSKKKKKPEAKQKQKQKSAVKGAYNGQLMPGEKKKLRKDAIKAKRAARASTHGFDVHKALERLEHAASCGEDLVAFDLCNKHGQIFLRRLCMLHDLRTTVQSSSGGKRGIVIGQAPAGGWTQVRFSRQTQIQELVAAELRRQQAGAALGCGVGPAGMAMEAPQRRPQRRQVAQNPKRSFQGPLKFVSAGIIDDNAEHVSICPPVSSRLPQAHTGPSSSGLSSGPSAKPALQHKAQNLVPSHPLLMEDYSFSGDDSDEEHDSENEGNRQEEEFEVLVLEDGDSSEDEEEEGDDDVEDSDSEEEGDQESGDPEEEEENGVDLEYVELDEIEEEEDGELGYARFGLGMPQRRADMPAMSAALNWELSGDGASIDVALVREGGERVFEDGGERPDNYQYNVASFTLSDERTEVPEIDRLMQGYDSSSSSAVEEGVDEDEEDEEALPASYFTLNKTAKQFKLERSRAAKEGRRDKFMARAGVTAPSSDRHQSRQQRGQQHQPSHHMQHQHQQPRHQKKDKRAWGSRPQQQQHQQQPGRQRWQGGNRGGGSRRQEMGLDENSGPVPHFGSFEQFTTGIGSRLMLSMGWAPGEGLGTGRQGRAEPLMPDRRPRNLGLGA